MKRDFSTPEKKFSDFGVNIFFYFTIAFLRSVRVFTARRKVYRIERVRYNKNAMRG